MAINTGVVLCVTCSFHGISTVIENGNQHVFFVLPVTWYGISTVIGNSNQHRCCSLCYLFLGTVFIRLLRIAETSLPSV